MRPKPQLPSIRPKAAYSIGSVRIVPCMRRETAAAAKMQRRMATKPNVSIV
jgi:hypothetical protein